MTKHILVTGGAGYIGSHTCKVLKENGYIPVVIDNLVYGHQTFVKWGPFIKGDIADSALLDSIFSTYMPRAVIHFAAFAYVGESVSDPAKYYLNNVCGSINLFEAMRRHQCECIVFSSSCATYGRPERIPIDEEHRQAPISPYGMSKLMIENILGDYDRAYGMKSVSLRYFNAAGADPECEIGEDHSPETHLIPLAIYGALGKRRHVEVFGTDYATADGSAVRDYIHVNDLARAHVLSLEKLETDKQSDVFNLGTGKGVSVLDVISSVELVSGCKVPVLLGDRRVGDPVELVADPSKAKAVLGWEAQYDHLDKITESAWKWHRMRH